MSEPLKQYSSLDDALSKFGIPDVNRPLIQRFVANIGIDSFYETVRYIKAVRVGDGPDLHIASGWTNGFISETEVVEVCGDIDRWLDSDRPSVWGVSHPENRIGLSSGGDAGTKRTYGVCPICNTEYFANGECGCS